MKLNLQFFGGRGQSSQGKRAKKATSQTIEEKFPIPDNISPKQKK